VSDRATSDGAASDRGELPAELPDRAVVVFDGL
jgi:hypothetical protein